MCGRFTFASEFHELLSTWELIDPGWSWGPRYNVAPGQLIPVIMGSGDDRQIELLKWGLVPIWAKDPSTGYKMINARSESVFEKPAFKRLILRKRCLIPADGLYEWQRTDNGKVPYRIVLTDRKLFAFAGLYDVWRTPSGQDMGTCTILTTAPNELMAKIHDRMPVILDRDQEDIWLSEHEVPRLVLEAYMRPYPAEKMKAYVVSKEVGNVANDQASLIFEKSDAMD